MVFECLVTGSDKEIRCTNWKTQAYQRALLQLLGTYMLSQRVGRQLGQVLYNTLFTDYIYFQENSAFGPHFWQILSSLMYY